MTQSYEQCAKSLLQERQLSRMPPFTHLCLLRIESAVAQQGVRSPDSALRVPSVFSSSISKSN